MKRIIAIAGAMVVALTLFGSAPAKAGVVDQPKSTALTKYLHGHRLPMVGAQVSTNDSGSRQVLLYGYVASDFGKRDAETKSRSYLHDPGMAFINRIVVDPGVRHLKRRPPEATAQGDEAPEARPTAEWENTVDKTLKEGGAVPSNDPELIPYR